jgi:hypothetical protein
MKKALLFAATCLVVFHCAAQSPITPKPTLNKENLAAQPFLFSFNTLTEDHTHWNINYSGSYGQRAVGQFGYDGLAQQFGVKGYLGNRFTLYATAAVGFANRGGITSSQQAEVLRDFVGGKEALGFRLGAGLGLSRDYSSVASAISRIAATFDKTNWRLAGNVRFEKAFDKSRDQLDLISSLGYQHRVGKQLYVGVEALGQDLEGFWEADEAEGGAKLMIGPSISLVPNRSKFSFSVAGGPVFYATHSTRFASDAIRDIGNSEIANGYTLRAMINFNLQ